MNEKLVKRPVKIQLFDQTLPVPAYQSRGAVGFDLYAREEVTLPPHELVLVPLNIAVELPPECWLMLVARSSLGKKGLVLINGVGVVDNDYCGPEDELRAALFNITDQSILISRGERIAQGVMMPKILADWQVTDRLEGNCNRGGFGTTGK